MSSKIKDLKNKVDEWWINYHGFLTEQGKGFSYVRWHSLGLGFLDGIDFHGEGYRLKFWLEEHQDVEEKPHYYEKGYAIGHATKYIVALALLSYFGVEVFWL